MTPARRLVASLLVALAIGAFAAACNSDDNGGVITPSNTPSTTTAP